MVNTALSGRSLWNQLAAKNMDRSHIDPVLGKYKSEEFRRIVIKWAPVLKGKSILKTDLREEAYGEDEILFSIPGKGSTVFALDIAGETTGKANAIQIARGLGHKYLTADVRELPFRDNSFDIILSSSTLDHFDSEDDFIKSLLELKRVMKPSGIIVITINNKCNLNFRLMLKLESFYSLNAYPVQSYTPGRLKQILEPLGLAVQKYETIVHIISPLNSILLLLRKFKKDTLADKLALGFVRLSEYLGKSKPTNLLTGWFIALKCVKNA
jgi:SAM-dependent methyltransferase